MMMRKGGRSLPKKERLCSQRLIDCIFQQRSSHLKEWPLRVSYRMVDLQEEADAPIEILVSVSKRYFKHAVDRNRVKRQIREAYRKHKSLLLEALAGHETHAKLLIAFIYWDGKIHPTSYIEEKVETLLGRMARTMAAKEEGQKL